jgi:hypothetical protein
MVAPLNTCATIEQRCVVHFLWAKGMAAKYIQKEMLPVYGEQCLHVKQSIVEFRSSRKGKQISKTNIESFGRWRLPCRQRILHRRIPATCETVGQVFKFVWRLCWKIYVVCMSLSPFISLQSLFITYLLTFPRNILSAVWRLYTFNLRCSQQWRYKFMVVQVIAPYSLAGGYHFSVPCSFLSVGDHPPNNVVSERGWSQSKINVIVFPIQSTCPRYSNLVSSKLTVPGELWTNKSYKINFLITWDHHLIRSGAM